MTNPTFPSRGPSELNPRLRFKNRARLHRRRSDRRLQLAAEISLLEERCMMSTIVVGKHSPITA
jgi:hypothetical protein